MKKVIMYVMFALMAGGGAAVAQNDNITLEDIWTKRTFGVHGVGGLRSMADGEHYCTLSRMGITKYSYATGEKVADVCLFNGPSSARTNARYCSAAASSPSTATAG